MAEVCAFRVLLVFAVFCHHLFISSYTVTVSAVVNKQICNLQCTPSVSWDCREWEMTPRITVRGNQHPSNILRMEEQQKTVSRKEMTRELRDLRIGNFRSNRTSNRIGSYDSNSNIIESGGNRLHVQCRLSCGSCVWSSYSSTATRKVEL